MILFYFAIAWLAGVIGAALGFQAWWPFLALAGAGVCLGLTIGGERRQGVVVGLLVLLCLAGVWRYEAVRPLAEPGGIALHNEGEPVTLRGVVSQAPEERERSQRLTVRVSEMRTDGPWQPTSGLMLVTTRLFPRFAYGDSLELTASLETPPSFEGFDYREYLARRGVVSLAFFPELRRTGSGGGSDLVRLVAALRRPFDAALQRSLPEPESALARGILLGRRAAIPANLTDDFNRSGISHLVAISGFNVTLVAGLAVAGLASLLGRRQAILAAMVLVVAFALFVGASPSVLRAALMGIVLLGAQLAGRPGSALTAVCLTGAALTAIQPLTIADVAFQLSFAATLGLVLLAKPIEERLLGLAPVLPSTLAQSLAVTTAASLAVLPIIAASFGRISIVALPANLLAVPAFPLIIGASFVTALAGVVSSDLGRLVGEVAYLPLRYLVLIGEGFARLPFASLSLGNVGTGAAVLLYGAIGGVGLLLLRPRRAVATGPSDRPLPRGVVLVPALLVLAAVVWWQALAPDQDRLSVTVLDVGQGDSILIETPAGQRILVDGGPSGSGLAQALGEELPASVHRLDLVVLTHGQDDHVTGLVTALQRYEVAGVLAGPLPGETSAYRAWRDEIERRSVPVHTAVSGEWVDLGDGVRLEVLGPPAVPLRGGPDDLNDNSVVLRLVYGEVSFLLTGDLAAAGEAALLRGGGDLRSTVLKVGHHGSDGSSTPAFLGAVDPALAVISDGAANPFGHPSPTTLLRLAGTPILRTDANGSVRLETDGRNLWVDFDWGDYRIVSPLAER